MLVASTLTLLMGYDVSRKGESIQQLSPHASAVLVDSWEKVADTFPATALLLPWTLAFLRANPQLLPAQSVLSLQESKITTFQVKDQIVSGLNLNGQLQITTHRPSESISPITIHPSWAPGKPVNPTQLSPAQAASSIARAAEPGKPSHLPQVLGPPKAVIKAVKTNRATSRSLLREHKKKERQDNHIEVPKSQSRLGLASTIDFQENGSPPSSNTRTQYQSIPNFRQSLIGQVGPALPTWLHQGPLGSLTRRLWFDRPADWEHDNSTLAFIFLDEPAQDWPSLVLKRTIQRAVGREQQRIPNRTSQVHELQTFWSEIEERRDRQQIQQLNQAVGYCGNGYDNGVDVGPGSGSPTRYDTGKPGPKKGDVNLHFCSVAC
ncbi:uncharacterized protein BDZ83DRAFT_645935 [Colletotrichum acutatum]|uniref:Uncharacterized protein n=1 Tax=Glomerella acutata TaxID=27357 RepID=A0AAD8XQ10_GLOAC|nr:uncharacterized protein BDZ83DRAFT_645935 [Colletotrichum acutatum]KAK1731419.1 hypothetical protein BDZ83DRAFT_645935 [Colletotrichum acutatum]